MILRKPYAFFIKMFKPMHLILSSLIVYLIFISTKIVRFLNEYMHSEESVIGQSIRGRFSESFIYWISIILIVFSLIIFGIMYRKKKPYAFYIINILTFIIVLVIYVYAFNFLGILEKSVISIKSAKLIHDLVLINVIIESFSFVIFVVRGMGLNFRKFDFDADISKFDISESDKEEFEFELKVDLDENKRKRREKLRHLKYIYFENKFLINIVLSIVLTMVLSFSIFIWFSTHKVNKEDHLYSLDTFSIGVFDTYVLLSDYRGNKITDNYLVVINSKIKSNFLSNFLYLNDFSLEIGDAKFKPTVKYADGLVDLGQVYEEGVLPLEYDNYLFVFEIPEKYIEDTMVFSYSSTGNKLEIKLNPKDVENSELFVNKNINEEISFEETLGGIKFKIFDFEIKDKYLIEYNYCVRSNECVLSREYLTSSIDENFDKHIIRLNVEYSNSTYLDVDCFYDFFEKFGSIYYQVEDKWYLQKGGFESIKSKKKKDNKNIYIGINSKISDASKIKLIFEIRGSRYEYVLK